MNQGEKKKCDKKQRKMITGKIYKSKRQPLIEITHYPKSLLIDDYYFDNIVNKKHISREAKQKIIKFIGDNEENVRQIIQRLDSLKQCENKIMMKRQRQNIEEQISDILQIFYGKVEKLRKQRDAYRSMYQSEKSEKQQQLKRLQLQIQQINSELVVLRKQKQNLNEKYLNETKRRQFFEREYSICHSKAKAVQSYDVFQNSHKEFQNRNINQFPDQTFNEELSSIEYFEALTSTKQPVSFIKNPQSDINLPLIAKADISHQIHQNLNQLCQKQQSKLILCEQQRIQLQSLLNRHNLNPSQLCSIIQQYLQELQQTSMKQFKNKQQKRLFLIAKSMQEKIWNMKIKKDIEKLMEEKEKIMSMKVENNLGKKCTNQKIKRNKNDDKKRKNQTCQNYQKNY